jgi:lactoylglutathione lyase
VEIDSIALFVADLPRSLIFYRDLLKFKFEKPPKDGGVIGFSGKLKIGLYDRGWLVKLFGENQTISGTAFLLSISMSDLEQVYEDLVAAKVNIIQPPTIMPWGQRLIFFKDPDHNLIEIVEIC